MQKIKKIDFVDEENSLEVVRYIALEHKDLVQKVLLYSSGVLICGNVDVHYALKRDDEGILIGAANCNNGKITSWSSIWFQITTSVTERHLILEALCMEEEIERGALYFS
jgi:hypothetical protein